MTSTSRLRGVAWATAALAALAGPLASTPVAMSAEVVDDAEADGTPKSKRTTHAQLQVIGSSTQVEPGRGVLLGARFVMDDGWHMYWDGQNDSGLPPTFTFELPAGWTVEPLAWPVPKRLVSEGGIVDHIYERDVTMLFKVHAPKDLIVGTQVPVVVRAKWLVCSDACIPERGESTWMLRVVTNEKQSPEEAMHRKQLMNVLASLPQAFSSLRGGEVSASHGTLRILVPGATRLVYLPDARSLRPADMTISAEAIGEELTVALAEQHAEESSEAGMMPRVGGLLGVRMGAETPAAVSVADPTSTSMHWYQFETLMTPMGTEEPPEKEVR